MVFIMLKRPEGLWPAPRSEDRPTADSDTADKSTDVVAV
jgi:branched-chain amino acid transport system permease protein